MTHVMRLKFNIIKRKNKNASDFNIVQSVGKNKEDTFNFVCTLFLNRFSST